MPKLSIVIATYNRGATLSRMLDSLLTQEMASDLDYELLMLDNNSNDNTKERILSYATKFSGRLHYLFEPKQGKAFALNKGIKNAKGDVIVFTDDDVILDPHWLTSIWQCFKKYDCDGLGGRILPLYPSDTPRWIKENAQQLQGPLGLYDLGTEIKRCEEPFYEFFGANYSFKRQIFDECGSFRTDVGPGRAVQGEDTEFVKRVFNTGKSLYYCGQALVWHPVMKRMTLKYIAQWNIALGRYRFMVDEHGQVDKNLASCFGAPRYLIREIAETALSLPFKIFKRREFLKAWIKLSLKLGMISEIRKRSGCAPSA